MEHATFMPVVLSASGGMGRAATSLYRQIALLRAERRKEQYSHVISYIRSIHDQDRGRFQIGHRLQPGTDSIFTLSLGILIRKQLCHSETTMCYTPSQNFMALR